MVYQTRRVTSSNAGGSHISTVPAMSSGAPSSSHGARRPQLAKQGTRLLSAPESAQRATKGPLNAFHQPMMMPIVPIAVASCARTAHAPQWGGRAPLVGRAPLGRAPLGVGTGWASHVGWTQDGAPARRARVRIRTRWHVHEHPKATHTRARKAACTRTASR